MRVALTFDAEHPDRPGCPPGVADAILDLLADQEVPATFFLQGRWARAHPETSARMARMGHLVGSHSHYHVRMPLLGDEGLRADVREAETAIQEVVGIDPRPWFRCPWGDGAREPRVLSALQEGGYRHAGWDVVAEDWEEDRSVLEVERDVVAGALAHGEGAVILLHAWPASAVQALPRIVRRLRAAGAEPVTLTDLERDLSGTRNPPRAADNPV